MPTSTLSQANFLDHEDTRHLNAEENQKRWMNSKIASTKLIALINRLKEWECDTETAMDKVIVYSQCSFCILKPIHPCRLLSHRDNYVG